MSAAAERLGTPSQIRLAQLSIFTRPPREAMAAIIKGWMDDSRREKFWVVGGYVGAWHRWEEFDTHWPLALAKHNAPHFHMREMADPSGEFAKWLPPEEHRDELAAFFSDLAKVISRSRLVAFCSLVRLQDLERFNTEHGLALEPYPLAAYGCMLLVRREYPDFSTELIFDHVEKVESKLCKARQYADSDKYEAGDFDKIATLALPKGFTFREIPALQAADFFAWEFRKNHEMVSDAFAFMENPGNAEVKFAHLVEWSEARFGTKKPPARKSAASLVEGNEFYPLVWDYWTLCEAHELRNGVWSLETAFGKQPS
jgi:hypothetical protein